LVSTVVNTVFVERHNGSDRNRNRRKVRKTYCFSKDWVVHEEGYNDGIWDEAKKCWTQYKSCKRKDCPRHWRLYAKHKFHQYKKLIPTFNFYLAGRFSLKLFLEKGKRYQSIDLFFKKVKQVCPEVKLICLIYHRNKGGDHIHTLFCSNNHIQLKLIRKAWQAHFPNKNKLQYKKQFCSIKNIKSPRGWLWYALLGKVAKPRLLPAWRCIPKKSPIKFNTINS